MNWFSFDVNAIQVSFIYWFGCIPANPLPKRRVVLEEPLPKKFDLRFFRPVSGWSQRRRDW